MRALTNSVVGMVADGASGSSKLLNFGGRVAGAGKHIDLLVEMAHATWNAAYLIVMQRSRHRNRGGGPPGHGGHHRATNEHL